MKRQAGSLTHALRTACFPITGLAEGVVGGPKDRLKNGYVPGPAGATPSAGALCSKKILDDSWTHEDFGRPLWSLKLGSPPEATQRVIVLSCAVQSLLDLYTTVHHVNPS